MNGNTRLSKALDSHPDVLELIVGLNPRDFSRLRNAQLRRFMAPRITLRRVAAMVGLPEADLVARVNLLAGEEGGESVESAALPMLSPEPPAWREDIREDAIPWVDVTTQDDAQEDPLPPIMAAWKALGPGETLGIKHRWEPQPLYDVWEKLGLGYWAEQISPDLWHIFVHRPRKEDSEIKGASHDTSNIQ